MKIGYLVPQFPGQTHIFFWREIAAMEAAGAQVQLFSTRPPPASLMPHGWSERAIARTTYLATTDPRDAWATLRRLPLRTWWRDLTGPGGPTPVDLAMSLGAARRLADAARAQGIGHVHVHSCGRAALIAAMARAAWGLRYSITLHGPLQDYGTAQPLKWRHAEFASVITNRLDREVKASLAGHLPPRVFVQPMGVEPSVFRRVTPYVAWGGVGPLRLFCCARLNIVKGHVELVDAVAGLRDRGIDVRLDIAGEDDAGGTGFRRQLEEHIAAAGLTGVVRLLGAISAEAVRDALHAAHVFVLASWGEPLGVAYMEAMASGVPVIGTRAGGVTELIDDGENGLLVEPRDVAALAEAILQVASDKALALRLAASGPRHVEARFNAARGARRLLKAIAEAGTDQGSRRIFSTE